MQRRKRDARIPTFEPLVYPRLKRRDITWLFSTFPSLLLHRIVTTIQEWTRMENPNWSAALAQSLSSSPLTSHPPSYLHPSTPASLRTRATCAHLSACQTIPWPSPRTHLHPSSLLLEKVLDSISPPWWPTWAQETKYCLHPLHPNQPHAACCAPVSFFFPRFFSIFQQKKIFLRKF